MNFPKGLHSLCQKFLKFHGRGNIDTASSLVLGVNSQHCLEIAPFQALSLLSYRGWGYRWNKLCCHRIKLMTDQGFEKGRPFLQNGRGKEILQYLGLQEKTEAGSVQGARGKNKNTAGPASSSVGATELLPPSIHTAQNSQDESLRKRDWKSVTSYKSL